MASVYHWYNKFKRGWKSVELMGGPGAPTTVLTKQTFNTGATVILDNPHLTVRQLASLLDISIESSLTLLLTTLSCVCLMDSMYKACTHLCGLLFSQDCTWSKFCKFCTLNFLTTPISVAFFNRISNLKKNLINKCIILADHTRSDCVGMSIINYFYVFNLPACGLETMCGRDCVADHTSVCKPLLSSQQKNVCVEVCQYLIKQVAHVVDYLNNIITTVWTWTYWYDHMFQQQTNAVHKVH